MELWYPPTDRPHLFEWWRPLILASRAARLAGCRWPIHVDELVLRGRVDRRGRPPIWVYRHPASGGELYLDPSGQAHSFTTTPKAKSLGRFTPCPIDEAIWRARLPEVVAPVDPPPPPPEPLADAPPTPRRRGHLTVHDGGRSLAG